MEIALPLQQHPHFAGALRALGREVVQRPLPNAPPVLTVRQWGQYLASRCVLEGGDAAALRAAGLRLINPDAPCPALLRAAGFRQMMTAAHVAEWDLSLDRATRLAMMKGKWRNAWRRAQDTPLAISQSRFDASQHRWLLTNDAAQQRQKRFRGLPHALITAFAARNPDDVRVFTAIADGTAVAAMLFLRHPPVVTYHLGWTNDTGRAARAHHRLLMAAADAFADQGITRLDLGTVDTETAPGLARFKIGTGARVRPLGGSWLKIPGL